MTPKAFRKIPVEVLAMRLITEDDLDTAWIWINNNGGRASQDRSLFGGPDDRHVNIRTNDGTLRASIGDWVVRTANGEFVPMRHEIFTATFAEVAP